MNTSIVDRILNFYFRRPVLIDLLIGTSISFGLKVVISPIDVNENQIDVALELISDLSTISLTAAGFILTFMTILITLKSSSDDGSSSFNKFFQANLYFQTVHILKYCIVSLVALAVIGYILRLFISDELQIIMFYYDILFISVIVLTLGRCVLILNQIVKLQSKHSKGKLESVDKNQTS